MSACADQLRAAHSGRNVVGHQRGRDLVLTFEVLHNDLAARGTLRRDRLTVAAP
jgi:hypothetical protein